MTRLLYLLLLFAALVATEALAQGAAVSSLIEKLADVDSDVRSNAAAELRKLLASDVGARTNNHGRFYWQELVDQIKPEMTHDEVRRLLPSVDDNFPELWSGGGGSKQWRLDDYWTVNVYYYGDPIRVHEMRPSLHHRVRTVGATLPKDFTGTWTTYHVNGQKAHEANYKNGKRDGASTSFHDNGRKSFEQHYVNGVCSGPDRGWYADGAVAYEGKYVDGKQDGRWTHWSEDGRLRSRREMRAGEYHGINTSWHENGQKIDESTYRNGKKHGPDTSWTEEGKLNYSHIYSDGELVQ